jgi:glycosyltransferase involved in cell wall biosynthesis
MKILFIGPYKDGTGWAHSATELILALDAAGIDTVCRPFKLNEVNGEVPPRILELEEKSEKGADIVIQNCLPHHTDYNGHFDKNIAYYFTETSHFKNSQWAERLNLLDEAWVPCTSVREASYNSNVYIPISIVPIPCNTHKYQEKYEKLNLPHLDDKFIFYTIGEINHRKNIKALIMAYHLEFKPDEPVGLVIKGYIPGIHPSQIDDIISRDINKIKDELKLYRKKETYLTETIITQDLTEKEIMQLHHTCHCYVSPSYGEGWNIPAFDAMAMGKTPICTNQGGPVAFLLWNDRYTKNNDGSFTKEERTVISNNMAVGGKYSSIKDSYAGWLVKSQPEPVFGMTKGTFGDIYVGNEEWESINIHHLRECMREAYENKQEREVRSKAGIERAYDFSHLKIGNIMKDLLEGNIKSEQSVNADMIRSRHEFKL